MKFKIVDKLTTKERIRFLIAFIAWLSLIFIVSLNAQEPYELMFEGGADLKMATAGSHPGEEKNIKGFDFIVGFGFEWEHIRVSNQFQSFQELGFYKWTYLKPDYRKKMIKNVFGYIGLEMSAIKRTHKEAIHPNNPENVFGANLEIQYRLNQFAISLQANIHQAEEDLKPYKDYRKQMHLKLTYYFKP
jgi:hypothetical protein